MKLDFHGHENNWSSKEPNQHPRNSLTIGSKFTVGCTPPYTVRGSLHLLCYPKDCKIPKDRVVERL